MSRVIDVDSVLAHAEADAPAFSAYSARISFRPDEIRSGLPFGVYQRLLDRTGVSARELAGYLSVSESTLRRRSQQGRFTHAESDRLARLTEIVDFAEEAFAGDMDKARRWLTTPHPLLEGDTPLRRADTKPGADQVRSMLGVIAYNLAA